ncbi:putative c-x8-c-x5-c-x3-h type zinc finger protein [Phaeoacremonium minimum UCRPA7]|uniref:Putative c-x8-c-x5-c-x3-h type zinc finger protein n=1 Tax=Phaeoacremonium minimum (strain UCR-PA7) TaxID=1286976 RepID=R8B8M5_PHAM7|nr:putative c-x8-c-x5-c-x3-h type zinc finger protein [Phaeoacremonium minimum UCRPA7]EON95627.1 putative c-x8-c-x5-c-x3-h type zinc finger protein [Phaeoacremonium minimum UCRPA7]
MNRHDDDLTANNSKKRKLGDDDELSDMYLARLDAFRKFDQDRNDMVQELIIKYNNLKQLYEHKEAEYESERETRLMWQKTAKEHDSELRQLKLVTESNSFVYAAIDGDGAYFKDDFIAQGQDGGSQAAYQLRADIKSYLQRQYPAANVEDWRIIVQVFLGADGLNKKLRNCGIIRDPQNSVTSFGIGFGLSQPLFSFVDVGYGKERADHKITEMMRAMIRLHQCKHLFFGPCNDNGYLNFLEEYKRDDAVAKKLTLIETQAAQRGFTALGLSRISFPAVFRSEPLPDSQPRPVANGAYANPAPASLPFSTITANSRERRATVAETGSPRDAYAAPAMERDPDEKYILLNADRDRVDERLRPADPMAEASYKEKTRRQGRNFCNFYHLNGL